MKIFYEGRSGHIEHEGLKYTIEHVNEGHFCIHFPDGNRHAKLQEHLNALKVFADAQDPKWYVDNRSKKYK